MRDTARSALSTLILHMVVAGSLCCATAVAAEPLDTSRLPRMTVTKETFVSPATTMFLVPGSVSDAADNTTKLLSAAGWQSYVPAFTGTANDDAVRIMSFKRGQEALSVFITVAPAQNDATSVSYTAVALANDLPFPKDAKDIEFSPDRPYLGCVTAESIDATMTFFATELATLGWQPWSRKTKTPQAATEPVGEKTDNSLLAYFVRDADKAVVLTLRHAKDGRTAVKLEDVPKSLLTASSADDGAKEEASAKPIASMHDPEKNSRDAFDDLAGSIMKQVGQATAEAMKETSIKPAPALAAADDEPSPPLGTLAGNTAPMPLPETADAIEFDGTGGTLEFTSTSSVKALAAFYRKAMAPLGWKEQTSVINKDNMVVLPFAKGEADISVTVMKFGDSVRVSADGSGLVTEAATTDTATDTAAANDNAATDPQVTELTVEDIAGLPAPAPHSISGSESSLFRVSANATVPATIEIVLSFYRRELGKRSDWKEDTAAAIITSNHAVLAYATPEGPALLTLDHKGNDTSATLLVRKHSEAEKAGMLPKAGQAKLLFGNTLQTDASIFINKQTVKIKAGLGSKKPDGPMLELPPGTYEFSYKVSGKPAQTDKIDIKGDEIWGLLIGPGGTLVLPIY